jgi:uncharacterized protein YkwD
MAVGAVAVASGLLPGGGGSYSVGGSANGEQVRAGGSPSDLSEQGGKSASPTDLPSASAAGRPSTSATPKASASTTAKPSRTPAAKKPKAPATPPKATHSVTPSSKAPAAPKTTSHTLDAPTPAVSGSDAAKILGLVNQERAKVGCSPLHADSSLNSLAQSFSDEMAARGFFDHTDPDGNTPWDRADKAGVKNLGGENIAQGQADAQAVMDAWMNSAGHRANILNCDYTRLGVGVHYGSGGPWWTQDFGF